MTARSERPFDVVVWGATGFTGKLVAEYLARRAGAEGLRWAIGGRNRDKLEAVRRDLAAVAPAAAEVPLEVADAHDLPALQALAARTRVVAATAGPFALHGSDMVAACVEQGTDYCDITGETHWIRKMADAHHTAAEQRGARIVHCCGFDSIPSDLGVLMMQEHAIARFGKPCQAVRFFLGENKGGLSGGTVASMLALLDEARRDRAVRRVLGDPYALDPPGGKRGKDGSDQHGVGHDPDVGWTGPFVMAAVNTRIVRRSNALLGYRYGEDFRYAEAMSFPPGPRGLAWASAVTAGVASFAVGATVAPLRKLIDARLPQPGSGPSREARERGYFKVRLFGTFAHGSGPKLLGEVTGHNDPGYGETAKMLGESALCLARDPAPALRGGVLTPASAMGLRLVERLRDAGMGFEMREA